MTRESMTKPEAAKLVRTRMSELLSKSATDPAFRSQLLSAPRATASAFFGVDLPESFRVVFVENKVDETYVLPDPVAVNAEISASELEAVSGGCTPLSLVAATAAAVASVVSLYDTIEDRYCNTSCTN
jgi:hypothetical protein